MFKEALETAVNDMFDHLGQEVVFKPKNGEMKSLVAVIKEPENPYEIGESPIVKQVADVSLKSSDITPKVGDVIEANSKKYKIFEEPLLDASTLIWRFNAALAPSNNEEPLDLESSETDTSNSQEFSQIEEPYNHWSDGNKGEN